MQTFLTENVASVETTSAMRPSPRLTSPTTTQSLANATKSTSMPVSMCRDASLTPISWRRHRPIVPPDAGPSGRDPRRSGTGETDGLREGGAVRFRAGQVQVAGLEFRGRLRQLRARSLCCPAIELVGGGGE